MDDSFLKEYLEKSLQYLGNVKDCSLDGSISSLSGPLNGKLAIIWNLLFLDKDIRDLLFETKENDQIDAKIINGIIDRVFSEMEERTSFSVIEFLSKQHGYSRGFIGYMDENFGLKYEYNGLDFFKSALIRKMIGTHNKINNDAHIFDETHIPIFIDHNKLPQLAWGHAKYAHYMNEQGLSFFKFRHAEHLPTPVREEATN